MNGFADIFQTQRLDGFFPTLRSSADFIVFFKNYNIMTLGSEIISSSKSRKTGSHDPYFSHTKAVRPFFIKVLKLNSWSKERNVCRSVHRFGGNNLSCVQVNRIKEAGRWPSFPFS